MIAPATVKGAVKAGGSVTVPMLALLPFDVWWLPVIGVGLLFGTLMRVAGMVDAQKQAREIRRYMLASLLAGGGNGIIAAALIWALGVDMLQGLVVAFAVALVGFQPMEKLAQIILPGSGIDRMVKALKWLFRQSEGDGK